MIPSKLVVIGTSAGGVTALQNILRGLDNNFALPIGVVHHLPASAQVDFKMAFHRFTDLKIAEVEDKTPIENRTIYFAPPGYHLLVEKDGVFSLSVDEPVHYSRPSVDVFFESAAEALGSRVIGVLLTGANDDGAYGMQCIQRRHGYTIVQDPADAEASAMPASALRLIKPDEVVPLARIAASLTRKSREVVHG